MFHSLYDTLMSRIPKFWPLLLRPPCVLDRSLTTPAVMCECPYGEISLFKVKIHVRCPEIYQQDFFMLFTNAVYFSVYEFATCLLFEE